MEPAVRRRPAGEWTHRLGNLLLLNKRKNSEANRKEFAEKKSTYFLSASGTVTFALTSQVVAEPEWNVSVVEDRQAKLLKLLVGEWSLEGQASGDGATASAPSAAEPSGTATTCEDSAAEPSPADDSATVLKPFERAMQNST